MCLSIDANINLNINKTNQSQVKKASMIIAHMAETVHRERKLYNIVIFIILPLPEIFVYPQIIFNLEYETYAQSYARKERSNVCL